MKRVKPLVWCIYGTRPEVIKMAPVVAALRRHPSGIDVRLIFTGQHRELASDLFEGLLMEPDEDLAIMRESQTLYALGARCLEMLGQRIEQDRPDYVLVQGDTSTVLFAALAAYFARIPLGHVEAGLRSFNKYAPFPEEIMRRLADATADFHFAPTVAAATNLLREGIDRTTIHVTGNTVVDAVRAAACVAATRASSEVSEWARCAGQFVLLTLHRRESFGSDLERILQTVARFAQEHPSVHFVYPVHPNPNVFGPASSILSDMPNVWLRSPLSYFDMIYLLDRSAAVLTDSGGVQEEAPALGRHVLVARAVTERPEGVQAGFATLVGSDPTKIIEGIERLLQNGRSCDSVVTGETPYGDGQAGERIADLVVQRVTGAARTTSDWRYV